MLENQDDILRKVEQLMKERFNLKSGDEIIVVMGYPAGHGSETNLIKFHYIP
jgi:pyruvate kinase